MKRQSIFCFTSRIKRTEEAAGGISSDSLCVRERERDSAGLDWGTESFLVTLQSTAWKYMELWQQGDYELINLFSQKKTLTLDCCVFTAWHPMNIFIFVKYVFQLVDLFIITLLGDIFNRNPNNTDVFPNCWAPYFIMWNETSHPAEKPHVSRLYRDLILSFTTQILYYSGGLGWRWSTSYVFF